MTDVYTRITKPTDQTYANVNAQGREQYDQNNIAYDDANTFYDGTNPNSYTNIAKPTSSVYSFVSKPII